METANNGNNKKTIKPIRISLFTTLVIGIIFSIAIAFSALLFIFSSYNRRIVEDVSTQIIVHTSTEIIQEVENYIKNAEIRLQSLHNFFGTIIVNDDTDFILLTLKSLLRTDYVINALYFADDQGRFFMAKRMPDGTLSNRIVIRKKNKIISRWIHENEALNRDFPAYNESSIADGYDPRTRPWYTIADPDEKVINWTTPYVFYSDKKIGITATQTIDKGIFRGVLAVDITLDYLQDFMKQLSFSKYGTILVHNDVNQIISNTLVEESLVLNNNVLEIRQLDTEDLIPELRYIITEVNKREQSRSDISTINATNGVLDLLTRIFIREHSVRWSDYLRIENFDTIVRQFKYDNDRLLYARLDFNQFNGVAWKIHLMIPADSIVGNVYDLISLGVYILIIVFILILLFVYRFSRRITIPILFLSSLMRRIGYLDLSVEYKHKHKIQINELVMMGTVYNGIRHSLNLFKKFVPNPIIKQSMIQEEELSPVMRYYSGVSFLFSDIIGFTTITEEHSPQDLSKALNTYLTAMSTIIKKYNGIIDKFIGDSVMAMFGIYDEGTSKFNHAEKACLSALLMQNAHKKINEHIKLFGGIEFYTRIGINSGDALIGLLGSDTKINFTAIGDSVNLASRLENLNKEMGSNILISHYTRKLLNNDFIVEYKGNIKVKGKEETTKIYVLKGYYRQISHA